MCGPSSGGSRCGGGRQGSSKGALERREFGGTIGSRPSGPMREAGPHRGDPKRVSQRSGWSRTGKVRTLEGGEGCQQVEGGRGTSKCGDFGDTPTEARTRPGSSEAKGAEFVARRSNPPLRLRKITREGRAPKRLKARAISIEHNSSQIRWPRTPSYRSSGAGRGEYASSKSLTGKEISMETLRGPHAKRARKERKEQTLRVIAAVISGGRLRTAMGTYRSRGRAFRRKKAPNIAGDSASTRRKGNVTSREPGCGKEHGASRPVMSSWEGQRKKRKGGKALAFLFRAG